MAGKNNQMIIWIRDLREKRVQDVLRHENLLAHRLHSRSLERTAYKGVCERKRKYDIAMKSKKKGNIVGPSEHEGKWPTEDASWRNPWSKLSSKVWLQYKTKILSSDLSREQPVLAVFSQLTQEFWLSQFPHFFLFYPPIIFITRRLITLNFAVAFAVHWHASAMDLHVFPILNPNPTSLLLPSLRVISLHQPQALVSCIQPGLVICFTLDNIHVSMLFSQIIPPSPSPIESKILLYTSVSLLLSCI